MSYHDCIKASFSPCSYSKVPQASCRSYFTELGAADFFIFSEVLTYKRVNLIENATTCLVSPRTILYVAF